MSVTPDDRIGTELLGYRIEAVLGRGGMGVVYRAYDLRLKRNVALKLLAPELASDERFRERFLHESELAASLEHPNVIPIHAAGEVEGVLFVAMRYVEGRDLKTLLREQGQLLPERALRIVSQVADALDAAHEHELVHRDVKPSNVLLDHREHAYLADFGLSRRLGEAGSALGAGLSLGTPAYVAPEQITGSEVDGRADQYSLACLLYECLTGQPPYPRSSEAAVLFAHLEEAPPAADRLKEVMAKGLAKSPEDRFATCGELVHAAREALGIAAPRRPRWPFAVAGVGAALLAAALLAVVLGRGGSAQPPTLEGNAVAAIDPASNRVVEQIPVGARPEGIAYGAGSLWVANLDDRTVQRIDPTSGRVVRTLALSDTPTGIAASSREVWVVGSNPARSTVSVTRIDPRFDTVGKHTRIPNVLTASDSSLATRHNEVWIAPSFGLLSRLDAQTGAVVQAIDPESAPADVAVSADSVWVTDTWAGTATRVDATTGTLTPIGVGQGPTGIAVGAGAVWIADSLDAAVSRIDPEALHVTGTIPVGRAPLGITVGEGSVWIANSQDGTVTRIDPTAGEAVKTIHVGGSPQRLVVAYGRVWVTVQPGPIAELQAGTSGGTARLVEERDWGPIENGGVYPDDDRQLAYATCAMIVNYPDRPAPAGSRLVPEVAASMPTMSSDGRTYVFRLRKGFRFSPPSNEPVTAANFKYALERILSPEMHSDARRYYVDIVGAKAYMAGKTQHVAGIVARGNRLVIRLRAPALDFLARLAMPFTCAVPVGTPLNPKDATPIPMAGPYYVASYAPGRTIVLERNPNYTGNRPHHLERIEVTFGVSGKHRVSEILSGAADYALAPGGVPPREASRLATRYGSGSPAAKRGGQRFFQHPQFWLNFFFLNTHRPLFRDVRMRRAVNYAIDRRALARVGPTSVPTDQYLPPGLPGFRDVRIYPDTPNVSTARRLVGSAKRTAVLHTCNEPNCRRLAAIVRENLKAIGIEVEVEAFPWPVLWHEYFVRGAPYDLVLANWILDYPDPADGLNVPLGSVYAFADLAYQRKLAAAARLSGPRRYLAYEKLDADLARNAAPWLAYANSLSADFFSARMGCQVYNPVYGIDLTALCIKKS